MALGGIAVSVRAREQSRSVKYKICRDNATRSMAYGKKGKTIKHKAIEMLQNGSSKREVADRFGLTTCGMQSILNYYERMVLCEK